MPVETPTSETKPQTFSEFHKGFESNAPAADDGVEVKVDDPTGGDSAKEPAKPATSEAAPDSEPGSQQGKVEARKAEIQRDIDALVRRREELKRETAALETPDKGKPPVETRPTAAPEYDGADPKDLAPEESKYATWQEWQDARAAWIGRKEFRKLQFAENFRQQQERQSKELEAAQASHKAVLTEFETRGAAFAAKEPEYPELVAKFKDMPLTNETAAVVVHADNGPELLHHLMKNPDELKRIEALPTAIKRLDAIYELKYKLKAPAETDPVEPPKSKARGTGTTLNGTGAGDAVTLDTAKEYTQFKKLADKTGKFS